VNQRTDLYALGATLYELATGQPPFGSGDPLALLHDHLARVPVPSAEVNPAVPEELSRIILHLLEKETLTTAIKAPTAWSTTWSRCGAPTPMRQRRSASGSTIRRPCCCPRRGWWVARPRSPRCTRRSRTHGPSRCRAVLVGGAPGVGKTALVGQLRPVATGGGRFVAGKRGW
jgi:serine/threonine protein kinase